MYAKPFDNELTEFIRSEMLGDIVFTDPNGKELSVPYKEFFTRLRQRESIRPHLELVSCVTSIDELYPLIYNCFKEDYGHVDFESHPEIRQKFSPVLFTLCLDFVDHDEVVIHREYTKQGKNIAYLEKLLYTEIYYLKPESGIIECVYYKDFLEEMTKSERKTGLMFSNVILEAQEILLSNSQKVEVSETVMLLFSDVFEGVVSPPHQVVNAPSPTYGEDLKFMFSSVGMYTCVEHINKIGDLNALLPVIYSAPPIANKKRRKHIHILVTIAVLTILVIGLVKIYYY